MLQNSNKDWNDEKPAAFLDSDGDAPYGYTCTSSVAVLQLRPKSIRAMQRICSASFGRATVAQGDA